MMHSYLNDVGKLEMEKKEKNVLLWGFFSQGEFRDVDKFITRNVY